MSIDQPLIIEFVSGVLEPDGKGYGPSDMYVVAEQLRHYLLALGYPKDDLTKALVRRYRPMFQTWSHPIGKS